MSLIAAAARVIVGLVFLASGALKLSDRAWPAAAAQMGAPRWVVPVVAPGELLLGACLAAGVAEPWPQWCALAVVAVFSAAVARVLRRPRDDRPACACFGRWSPQPVTGWSMARNAALGALIVLSLLA